MNPSFFLPSLYIHQAGTYTMYTGVLKCYVKILLMEEILHQLIGRLSHYLQGFIHPRWLLEISFMNSMYAFFWLILMHTTVDDSAGTEFLTLAAAPKV